MSDQVGNQNIVFFHDTAHLILFISEVVGSVVKPKLQFSFSAGQLKIIYLLKFIYALGHIGLQIQESVIM